MEGFLLIDKPAGPTSHDIVNRVRRATGEKRVGHAGTLDPFATGLLIVGVGRVATREFPKLVGLDKEYEAVFMLGATSDTDDRTGKIEGGNSKFEGRLKEEDIRQAMKTFTGSIEQIPPVYSAIKIGGKKMYEAARAGSPLKAKPRSVTIYAFDLLDTQPLHVRVHCSSGTYIRSLARDLGAALGVGGYVEELRRTAIGPFRIEEASNTLVPVPSFLSRLPTSATVTS